VVPAIVNVRGLPYVIRDSMPPIGEESDEQTRAYRKDVPPSWNVVSKNFAKNYGLVVQVGGVEELNALGKGGCAQRKPIFVSL
jgi:hypothetical protein